MALVSWRKFDWTLGLTTLSLSAIGLATIYSVDLSRGTTLFLFRTQLTALLIALVVFIIASSLHMTLFESSAKMAYVFGCALLVGVLFFGTTVRGTTGWFRVGTFSFQPA